jgi:hypothetical protein
VWGLLLLLLRGRFSPSPCSVSRFITNMHFYINSVGCSGAVLVFILIAMLGAILGAMLGAMLNRVPFSLVSRHAVIL